MSCDLHYQSGLLDQERTVTMALCLLCLNRLDVLVKIGAQKLPQVRRKGALPGNGKDFSSRRDVFLDGDASRRLNFMDFV